MMKSSNGFMAKAYRLSQTNEKIENANKKQKDFEKNNMCFFLMPTGSLNLGA